MLLFAYQTNVKKRISISRHSPPTINNHHHLSIMSAKRPVNSITKKSTEKNEKQPLLKTKSSKSDISIKPQNIKYLGIFRDHYQPVRWIITLLAFITRFWWINYPNEVVFDEVHFGKFASYYLEGTYFFDLHPPFAKLLYAAVGYLAGYNGAFKFDNIGDSYIDHKVPYVAYRALPATLGALTVPIVFNILQESGYSVWACILGSSLILFDNAHIAEDRLILLDATLIFSVAISIYSYVRFSKTRNEPFSRKWWRHLILTGVSLSCTISTKYVGAFTFAAIGFAVLVDLWNLLDIRAGLTLKGFSRHFFARALALIIIPLAIFLYWFWVHFEVLYRSGPGDGFMSPEFQETLGDNIMARDAREVYYYDTITMKHKQTAVFLHSHEGRYPLRYDDGRISSQGQQVTGYGHDDENNYWQILPEYDFPEDEKVGNRVKAGDRIRLRHIVTNSLLLAHDVASPWYPTNEEFTTLPLEEKDEEKYPFTLFYIDPIKSSREVIKSKSSFFKINHVETSVSMFCQSEKPLPDWGFGQFEVNGNKNNNDAGNVWSIDSIIGMTDDRADYVPKEPKKMPFLKKYLELQSTMFAQNNALTQSHPYASAPVTWPFLIRGVSFWTKDADRLQIYFIGNLIGWWLCLALTSVYIGVIAADQLTRRRQFFAIGEYARNKLYNSMGFFFIAWLCHYLPFFLMGRQLFLHHYLPAHLISALLAGGVFDFVMGDVDNEENKPPKRTSKKLVISTVLLVGLIAACFIYYAPVTYGYPSLAKEQVKARNFLSIDLHYGK